MSIRALIPFTLNAGLRRPRRGFTLVAGKEKMGAGMGTILAEKVDPMIVPKGVLNGIKMRLKKVHETHVSIFFQQQG